MGSFYIPSEEKLNNIKSTLENINTDFTDYIINSSIVNGFEIQVSIHKEHIENFFVKIKSYSKCNFEQLMDVTAVDYPERVNRFEMVYNLLSISSNIRLRVKSEISESESVDTISHVYGSADWWEREVFDMYGIYFNNHPDMRRILTDYGFEGYPLRKDFPLSGYSEVYFDEKEGKVKYKDLHLNQMYRDYKNKSPWENEFDKLMDEVKISSKKQ